MTKDASLLVTSVKLNNITGSNCYNSPINVQDTEAVTSLYIVNTNLRGCTHTSLGICNELRTPMLNLNYLYLADYLLIDKVVTSDLIVWDSYNKQTWIQLPELEKAFIAGADMLPLVYPISYDKDGYARFLINTRDNTRKTNPAKTFEDLEEDFKMNLLSENQRGFLLFHGHNLTFVDTIDGTFTCPGSSFIENFLKDSFEKTSQICYETFETFTAFQNSRFKKGTSENKLDSKISKTISAQLKPELAYKSMRERYDEQVSYYDPYGLSESEKTLCHKDCEEE